MSVQCSNYPQISWDKTCVSRLTHTHLPTQPLIDLRTHPLNLPLSKKFTHVDGTRLQHSSVLDDFHSKMVLVGVPFKVQGLQEVDHTRYGVNGKFVGLPARVRGQFVGQRVTLVREGLHLDDPDGELWLWSFDCIVVWCNNNKNI